MKRTAHPPLSPTGQEALASYEHWSREREDLASASIRNYLSDLRHFIAWYETEREAQVHDSFTPQGNTTSALTRYRTYLQTCTGYLTHPFKKSLPDTNYAFQAPFLRTDVVSSQYRGKLVPAAP